jgi:hypothetical protein
MRRKKISKTGDNPEVILCKKTHQFANIIVCTYQCFDRCDLFYRQFDMEMLYRYIETHPNYEIKGVIMSTGKNVTPVKPTHSKSAKEKVYWIITGENEFTEVTESEIISNPAEYLGKPMFEKPRDQYEVVVTIKKKTS